MKLERTLLIGLFWSVHNNKTLTSGICLEEKHFIPFMINPFFILKSSDEIKYKLHNKQKYVIYRKHV